jgi:triacylglycerol esterase/lipase EstA (alpha/beta hydrolase family)
VAIHGLGGHPFRTWTDKDGHLWLRDSLPEHIPHSRIFTYGYDSGIFFSRSRSQTHDFALDLLFRLHSEQRSHPRPILFVCHSLGGVVFKQALVLASSNRDHYGDLLKSIRGVVFMGTPHRGSRTAGPALHLSRIINTPFFGGAIRSDLVKALKVSSQSLEEISYMSLSLLQDLSIVSFYE